MRVLTVENMRKADEYTINVLGISSSILVERAGNAVTEEILKRFAGGRVLVLAGKGNNGEDAKVVHKLLSATHGFNAKLFEVANDDLSILEEDFDIIVDGIFGTGLSKEVSGKYYEVIQKINQKNCIKISIDIPSGLNGNTGLVLGIAVKADLTVSIQEYKPGLFIGDGIDYAGEVVNKDIGISVFEEDNINLTTISDIKEFFPPLKRRVNKGNFGKGGIIGGSRDYLGAPLLSFNALSVLKMGAGYSYLAVEEDLLPLYIGKNPECILLTYDKKEDLEKMLSLNALGVGMGLGNKTVGLLEYILKNYKGNLLIDADGLNILSKNLSLLENKKCKVILTPHLKEFSRLTGLEVDKIRQNPINIAKDFAKEQGVVLLLKDAVSIITDGERVYINITGTSGMAKAGSGDVLSGIIVGLMARGLSLLDAGKVGAYLFGKAGENASKKHTDYAMTASDIINEFGGVIKEIEVN
ncbi:MAG: NAD(P)H-hydrate dehydratase [Clostridiales bacterium]|nr:NAD(P)H-hydrate dehydratase [Clostridiales bacterium]